MPAPSVDIDALVEAAEIAGMAGSVPTRWLIAQNPRLAVVVGQDGPRPRGPKALPWTPDEDAYLAANLGYLAEADIAAELGRTQTAVHLRWSRDLRLPAPSKTPGWLTPNRAARCLGIDLHCVMRLIRDGVLPAEPLPWLNHGLYATYRLRQVAFYRWAVNPAHWIYFRIERVRDAYLRRLLQLKAARWDDEWLTPSQAAALHGVDHKDVNRFIRAGKLPAVRWNNWRILRSDALRVRFYKGRGQGHELAWSPAADAFMLAARGVGLPLSAIAALSRLSPMQVSSRLEVLRADPVAARLAGEHGFDIQISADGRLFVDWRQYRRRFPAVTRALDRFAALLNAPGEPVSRLDYADGLLVRGVFWSWATWHATTEPQRHFARNLTYASNAAPERLVLALRELRAWGVDPLAAIGHHA